VKTLIGDADAAKPAQTARIDDMKGQRFVAEPGWEMGSHQPIML